MHFFASAVLVAIAASDALASPVKARSPYAVKETHYVPREWQKLGRAHGAKTIQLQIGLKQGRFEELDRHLHEVSDPDHVRYGQHLTPEEVDELVAPTSETYNLVHEWLRENGISTDNLGYSSAKDWVIVHLPIEMVESLLDTEYHTYKHKDGSVVARTTKWSLPRHLHSHIDTVQPTTSFFKTTAQASTLYDEQAEVPASYKTPLNNTIAAVCNVTSVTPECFQTLYKTKWYQTKASHKNSVAFNNFLGEIPIRPDTKKFLEKYRPEAVSQAYGFKTISIDNGPLQDGALTLNQSAKGTSREANLDVQAIAGISWKTPITSYSTGGSPPFTPDITTPTNTNEPYLVWVNWLLTQRSIPNIISTSYGDSEQTVPRAYAERVCRQFAQVGARGTTLFFSSGDSGIGGTDSCYTNDGTNKYQFNPNFPASCPYVTTVGATMNFQPEEAAYRPSRNTTAGFRDLYASGSGFSNYFSRPSYQDKVVPKYIKELNGTYDGLYNKTGRGYPDLAAQGLYFAYFWNGTEGTISGTSASSPLTAGIFALVNDALISKGKPTLGFLNPWLYKKGYKGLTDITKGTSHGCNVDGFPVTKGWDPVTGFGTPDFPELVKLAC
ncbi:tripeptidyl-peptidase 1 precursor [Pyrenophora tritici-repentis]|uniref:tripeptidyl-peptidase II n=2 Tax=Pyrenophora tritici-repentis TaxID=45151 RepID=A0A2W1F6U4_9PLEO|nr:tripeptidyl-peptidase 1 precursor [Pyrenophora tritici-repentis Pt-1C-BFP]KAA8614624.1 tripeptidyl-peptidase 1 [Pyrenophora tritici-repentis]EDU49987.1 tripeptidyl-peptidase 1 precursor [Pyrenophora tritici-repentis Pt-1C-BFP]KAF7444456.1 tripeptidyl-peptidase 1 [Pyrenophora tritici-repentis]KAF7564892.1 Pro-kuma-activ multi-domain protein [Pyrenophora tritici-repentis]KAG9378697.1 tripeptidyl-peptidase 1 [Pyrenophora tritici-repentis]